MGSTQEKKKRYGSYRYATSKCESTLDFDEFLPFPVDWVVQMSRGLNNNA